MHSSTSSNGSQHLASAVMQSEPEESWPLRQPKTSTGATRAKAGDHPGLGMCHTGTDWNRWMAHAHLRTDTSVSAHPFPSSQSGLERATQKLVSAERVANPMRGERLRRNGLVHARACDHMRKTQTQAKLVYFAASFQRSRAAAITAYSFPHASEGSTTASDPRETYWWEPTPGSFQLKDRYPSLRRCRSSQLCWDCRGTDRPMRLHPARWAA